MATASLYLEIGYSFFLTLKSIDKDNVKLFVGGGFGRMTGRLEYLFVGKVLNHIVTQKVQGNKNTIIFTAFQKNVSLTKKLFMLLGTLVSELACHNMANLPLT